MRGAAWVLVLASGCCIVLGALLFAHGCDERLQPWCTEDRHRGWHARATTLWPSNETTTAGVACARANLDLCSVPSVIVQVQSVLAPHDVCNLTVPTLLGKVVLRAPSVMVWRVHDGTGKGCRLDFQTSDVMLARVGFALLWAPLVMLVVHKLVRYVVVIE